MSAKNQFRKVKSYHVLDYRSITILGRQKATQMYQYTFLIGHTIPAVTLLKH